LLIVLSPTPVNCIVLSPTFPCELHCAITHIDIVLSPTQTPFKPNTGVTFKNRNQRAFFNF